MQDNEESVAHITSSDSINIKSAKLADSIQHMVRILKQFPMSTLDDASFRIFIRDLTSIIRHLLPDDARFALIVEDEKGRTLLGNNYKDPAEVIVLLQQTIDREIHRVYDPD